MIYRVYAKQLSLYSICEGSIKFNLIIINFKVARQRESIDTGRQGESMILWIYSLDLFIIYGWMDLYLFIYLLWMDLLWIYLFIYLAKVYLWIIIVKTFVKLSFWSNCQSFLSQP